VPLRTRQKTTVFWIEKGKPAIVVGAKSKLDGILVTLITAAKAGELDRFLTESPQLAKLLD